MRTLFEAAREVAWRSSQVAGARGWTRAHTSLLVCKCTTARSSQEEARLRKERTADMVAGSVWRNETHEDGQVDAKRARRGAGRSGRRVRASHSREARSWDDGVVRVRPPSHVRRIFLFRSARMCVDVCHDASTRARVRPSRPRRLARAPRPRSSLRRKNSRVRTRPARPVPSPPLREETPRPVRGPGSVPVGCQTDVFDRVNPGSSHVSGRRGGRTYGPTGWRRRDGEQRGRRTKASGAVVWWNVDQAAKGTGGRKPTYLAKGRANPTDARRDRRKDTAFDGTRWGRESSGIVAAGHEQGNG
mmetsp:Transcript_9682/g.58527  ORF Transcript_9682/g.58527 Transcript_9682/m.58527 type:complete len:303 (-) Transcript_9682:561-1469(-)